MDWLNYHHLYYFWTVARMGSVTAAGKRLRLAQSTVSAQIRQFEEQIGYPLFLRVGRKLELTRRGRLVYGYAEEIFTIGQEMMDVVRGAPSQGGLRLILGVPRSLSDLAVARFLEPVERIPEQVRLSCISDRSENLWAELSIHSLDGVLSDTPIEEGLSVRAYNHLLVDSGSSVLAEKSLIEKFPGGFPEILFQIPLLLPSGWMILRRRIDLWLLEKGIRPNVTAEFDSQTLIDLWAAKGRGAIIVPSWMERDYLESFGLKVLGKTEKIRQRIYLVSAEKQLRHPALKAIYESTEKA